MRGSISICSPLSCVLIPIYAEFITTHQKSKIKKITYTFMNIAHDNAHITKQKINSISTR